MKRRGVLVLLCVSSIMASTTAVNAAGVPPQLSEAESRVLAQDAAQRAFAAFVPPPGALASATGPSGAVEPPGVPTEDGANVVAVRGWWVLNGTPGQAIAYVAQHAPAGSSEVFRGNFEGSPPRPGIPTLPTDVGFEWPGVPRARGSVRLVASATKLSSGATALEVGATAFWLTPRASTEAVPPAGRLLKISVLPYPFGRAGAHTNQRPLSITSRSRIERVVTIVNALPLAQPLSGVRSCPAPRGVVLRLAFYRDRRAKPVAVIRDSLVPCGGVQLDLNGHEEPPLEEGGNLPEEVSEAIGVKLDTRLFEPR